MTQTYLFAMEQDISLGTVLYQNTVVVQLELRLVFLHLVLPLKVLVSRIVRLHCLVLSTYLRLMYCRGINHWLEVSHKGVWKLTVGSLNKSLLLPLLLT